MRCIYTYGLTVEAMKRCISASMVLNCPEVTQGHMHVYFEGVAIISQLPFSFTLKSDVRYTFARVRVMIAQPKE